MKKNLLLVFAIFLAITSFSQTNKERNKSFSKVNLNISYEVGNKRLGFPEKSKLIPRGYVTTTDRFPILKYYEKNQNKTFVGSKLVNELTKDTAIIKRVKLIINKDNEGEFYIDADKFDFTLFTNNGYILEETEKTILLALIDEKEIYFYKILKK